MPRRFFKFVSSLASLFALFVLMVSVGCVGDDAPDGSVASLGGSDESGISPATRVAMSKEAFVAYVANESPGRPEDGFFLFLKLPGNFTAADRKEKYADPIDLALQQAELGKVVSGAAMMGARPFSSVSVEVSELAEGLDIVIETLRAADPPPGTEIRHGEGDDKKFLCFDSLK